MLTVSGFHVGQRSSATVQVQGREITTRLGWNWCWSQAESEPLLADWLVIKANIAFN